MTDLACIVKRYMVNTENRRLEEEQAVSDSVFAEVMTHHDKAVVATLQNMEHSKSMIKHIKRLQAIEGLWGGVGGGVALGGGGGDDKDTADMPALVQVRPSRFEMDRQRNRCLQMMFLEVQ
jgi:hypothetical protein